MSMVNEFKTKLKALMEEYNAEIFLTENDDQDFELEVDLGPENPPHRTYSNLLHTFEGYVSNIDLYTSGFKAEDLEIE